VRFARAYAAASWTKPAMASLLTGLYPSGHGVTDVRNPLPASAHPLAVRLAAHGYRTAGVVSNVQLTNADGNAMGRGFARYVEIAGGPRDVSTPAVTEQAIRALRGLARADGPFFLLAHYFDPHADYRRHPPVGFAARRAGRLDGSQPIEELQNELLGSLDPAEVAFLRDLYDEEIRFTDAGIGRLLRTLDELGLAENTLVVFTADHGEEFLEHGWLGHVRSLYEELIRVPLIVRDPAAVELPRVVETPVSLVSLTPTLLELLGIPAEGSFDGPSLAGVIARGGEPEDAPVYAEVSYVPLVLPYSRKRTFKKAVVAGGFKLVEDGESGRRELYDLGADPTEHTDLGAARPELADGLAALLERFAARGGPDAGRRELSEAERQQLRELGYLGP
jgi:arylsulfatase A-like enzyme